MLIGIGAFFAEIIILAAIGVLLGWLSFQVFSHIPKKKTRVLTIPEWLLACLATPVVLIGLTICVVSQPTDDYSTVLGLFGFALLAGIPISIASIVTAAIFCYRYNKNKR